MIHFNLFLSIFLTAFEQAGYYPLYTAPAHPPHNYVFNIKFIEEK